MTEALNAGVNEEFAMIGRSLILLAGVLLFADARDAIAGGGAANPESSTSESRDSGSGADAASLQYFPDTPEYKACKSRGLVFVSQGKRLYYCWDRSADEVWNTLGSVRDVKGPRGTVRSIDDPKVRVACFRWEDPQVFRDDYPYYTTCVLAE
jgi:hypothetical protein